MPVTRPETKPVNRLVTGRGVGVGGWVIGGVGGGRFKCY